MTRAADLAKLIAGGGTITVDDNSDTLTLESTDADANVGPILNLHRNSASPADNDLAGRIVFKADDDAGNAATFARIEATATDVSNGGEDGRLDFFTAKDDAFNADLSLLGNKVGINTTSPDAQLVIARSSGSSDIAKINLDSDSIDFFTAGKTFNLGTTDNTVIRFFTNNSEAFRVDDSGRIGIGTTSPGSPFTLVDSSNNSAIFQSGSTDDHDLISIRHARASTTTNNATVISFKSSSGTEVGSIKLASNDTLYDTTSDYRLKENVNYNWDATTKLKELKPCEYNWISDEDNKVVTGFLAHEVQSVISNAVSGEKDATKELNKVIYDADGGIVNENIEEEEWVKGKEDGTYAKNTTWHKTKTVKDVQGIDQSKLVPLLTKSLQEALARIDTLEAEVAKLKG